MEPVPFERVVAEHGTAVLRVLRGVVGPADADDAWQETFLAALHAWPRLRPDSNVRGWLVTIAHRKGIDALRSRGRAPVPVDELPEPAAAPGGTRGALVADEVLDGLASRELWARVTGLPPKQRLAVAYRYGADLGYPEIAGLLGCSEAAARRSAFEGVRRLRGDLLAATRHGSSDTDEEGVTTWT